MATVAQAATPGTNHVIGCPCIYCAEIARLTADIFRLRYDQENRDKAWFQVIESILNFHPNSMAEAADRGIERVDRWKKERDSLAAENRVMREALGLYADKRNWEPNAIDIGVGNLPEPGSERILQDGGEIARRTLTQPHTAREVARVKALEAVAEAARANVNGEDDGRPEYDLAAKVADLDRGGKGK